MNNEELRVTPRSAGNVVNLRKQQRSYLLLCHLELVERSFIYQNYGISKDSSLRSE